jgi:hypothetical protein
MCVQYDCAIAMKSNEDFIMGQPLTRLLASICFDMYIYLVIVHLSHFDRILNFYEEFSNLQNC